MSPFGKAGRCSSEGVIAGIGLPSGAIIPGKNGGRNWGGIMAADSSLVSFKYIATWRRIVELRGPLSCCTAENRYEMDLMR